jgi:hypothetical protein
VRIGLLQTQFSNYVKDKKTGEELKTLGVFASFPASAEKMTFSTDYPKITGI